MKKKKYYILAFIIPIIIFLFISIILSIYPFGDILINKFNSVNQYPSILIEYINKIRNHESLFYSFHGGLGTNFWGIIAYYCASPLNLLFLLFKTEQVYLFYYLIIVLKIGLSGLTMYILLNSKNKDKLNSNLLFAIIYALSSFMLVNCYHIMWSDAFYLAPLVIMGVDKLVKNQKIWFYCLFLVLAIYFNFYTGYMLGVFSILYFIYLMVIKGELDKQLIKKFVLAILCVLLLTAIVTVPTGLAIFNGKGINDANYLSFNISNLFSFFYNLLPGSFELSDVYNEGTAVVGATIFCLALVVLYFFNKKFSKKERIATLCFLLFFLLSISFNLIDCFWHMFSKPIWWNNIYTFLFILLMILIAHKSFINIDGLHLKAKSLNNILLSSFIIILASFSYKVYGKNPTNQDIIIFFSAVIILFIYYFILSKKPKKNNFWLTSLVLIELIFNGLFLINTNREADLYSDFEYKYINSISKVNLIKHKDSSFYRVYDKANIQSGMTYSFNSPQLFSSVYNSKVLKLYNDYLEQNDGGHQSVSYLTLSTPTLEVLTLLNTNYILGSTNSLNALPFGYLIDNNKTIKLKKDDYYNNINSIYSYLSNQKLNLYKDISFSSKHHNISIDDMNIATVTKGKPLGRITLTYLSPNNGILTPLRKDYFNKATIYINDVELTDNFNITVKKGDLVKIEYELQKADKIVLNDLTIKLLDDNLLNNVIDNISENKLLIEENSNNLLTGYINVKNSNQKLFLTIPYDEGLVIKDNNKRVEFNEEFNTFVSLNLSKGEHKIEISFIPKGLLLGVIITLLTVLMLLTRYIFSLKLH